MQQVLLRPHACRQPFTSAKGNATPGAAVSRAVPRRALHCRALSSRSSQQPTQQQDTADTTPSTSVPSSSSSSCGDLWMRAALSVGAHTPTLAALVVLGLAVTADGASASELHGHASSAGMPIADLAEEPIGSNLARYARYFVTVMLGTGYVMLRPLQGLLKKPVTAVFAIAAVVALVVGTKIALQYMLGLDVYAYDASEFKLVQDYTQ